MKNLAFHAITAALLSCSGFTPRTYAHGSAVTFDNEGKSLLRSQPELLAFVTQTLDVSPDGHGTGGFPAPPLRFQARPKGQQGPFIFELLIDRIGPLSPDDTKTERRVHIELRPLKIDKP